MAKVEDPAAQKMRFLTDDKVLLEVYDIHGQTLYCLNVVTETVELVDMGEVGEEKDEKKWHPVNFT